MKFFNSHFYFYNFFNINAFIYDVIYKMSVIVKYRKGKYIILPIFSLEILFMLCYLPIGFVDFL